MIIERRRDMKRRRNNEGAYGTCKRGKYTYKFYRFPNGKQIYAKTAAELEYKKKEYEKILLPDTNPLFDNKYTVTDYSLLWLKTKQGQITARVYDEYEREIKNHIRAYDIGKEQIHYITPEIVNQYFLQLATKYSRGTIDKAWTVLRQVISYAIDNGVLKEFNKEKVKKPKEENVKVKKKDVAFVTEEDMKLLYKESLKPKYGLGAKAVVFIMYSGLRVSEACALQWDCVSKNYDSIHVKRSQALIKIRDKDGNVQKDKDGNVKYTMIDKETKTKSGDRIVPLPSRAQEILKSFDDGQRNGYVFQTARHKPFSKDLIRRTFKRMMKNAGCSNQTYTVHSLRHGYGSLLIRNGVDIKIVSELLGHSDVTTTYNIYIGILKQDKIDAVKNVFDTQIE